VSHHLLVTNDFPPKAGGIQSYLWELWRRLPPDSATVLTTPHEGAAAFDAASPFRIERTPDRVLLPTASLRRRIDRLAADVGAEIVLLDPALPLGLLGPSLERPYGIVVHGAEVTIPGRLPGSRALLGRVARGANLVIAAGGYPAAETARVAGAAASIDTVVVPPGVDTERFHPLDAADRTSVRARFGLDPDALVVLGLSRLVPRKGFDRLIDAVARLAPTRPDLVCVIAGDGRDRGRLERRAARRGAPVRFLGRVSEGDLPLVHAAADVFAMICRNRWFGLEQEGFGIVFLEAAAAGVPQLAGASGGSHEAVVDGVTGTVVRRPRSSRDVASALAPMLDSPERRRRLGRAARERVVEQFPYEALAGRLAAALDRV
jgi:phosphatidylinositol alpha-1,6-mannosyltransferase